MGRGWELRLRLQRWIPGRGLGLLCEHSLKGASVSQLAGRESRKKSGTAEEARDHCFGVHEERGFLLCVSTEGRALPKRAPETGASHGYQLRPQKWAWTANTAVVATKNPVCKRRSLPTPPPPTPHSRSLCSPPLPGCRDPGTTSLGEHSVPQHIPIMTTVTSFSLA